MNLNKIPEAHRGTITRLYKGGDKLLPQITEGDISIFHATIGISGEAGELAEAVLPMRQMMAYKMAPSFKGLAESPWEGRDGPGVDIVNIREELGDHLFYEGALRIAAGLEELPDLPPSEDLWASSLSPSSRANLENVGRKLVLCELIDVHVIIASRMLDLVKKCVMYRKELDVEKLTQCLVDGCWVVSEIAQLIGVSEETLREENIVKLETGKNARYKGGYTDEAAQVRADKVAEEAAAE